MMRNKIPVWLLFVVMVAVAIIGGLSFAMSNAVLEAEANAAGVYHPWAFPYVVDAGIVVFILTRLLAKLRGMKQAGQLSAVAIALSAVVSVGLNIAHAVNFGNVTWSQQTITAVVYFVIPPIFLAVCSEFVAMFVQDIATASNEDAEMLANLQHERDRLQSECDTLQSREIMPELPPAKMALVHWLAGNITGAEASQQTGISESRLSRMYPNLH